MANMGYPVVTRLGISQFWYKHWFSDSSYLLYFKNDLHIINLLEIYLNFGITMTKNIFLSKYFFKYLILNINYSLKNLKFFRKFYFTNSTLGIEHSYLLRYRSGENFRMRYWIIKYSNWVVICFTCFKPNKITRGGKKSLPGLEVNSLIRDLSWKKVAQIKRLKLTYLYMYKCYNNKIL